MTEWQTAYIEEVTITRVGQWENSGRQWIEWGGCGVGIPFVEYTPKVGDRVTFYWRHPSGFGTPYGLRFNGGVYIPYDDECAV